MGRRALIERESREIAVSRQCELLGVSRSGLYYEAAGESAENLALMRFLDEQYTRTPVYGVLRMEEFLRRQGYGVNVERVRRLWRSMGLEAVYARPRLSENGLAHRRYPYLLKRLVIERPNQVWTTDITYIRLRTEFIYLAVVLDAFSRRVIGWAVGRTLEAGLAVSALTMALRQRRPEPGLAHHSDRGVQYASHEYTGLLKEHRIQISMSRKGNPYDNAACESFMKTLKYEVDCTPEMRHEVKGPNTLNGEVYGFGPENVQPRSEDRGYERD